MPLAPQERVEIPLAEALDGRRKLALEREAAHLAVRDDVEARVLLEADRVVHRGVLGAYELVCGQLAAVERGSRLEQLGRPQQAPDDVRSRLDHAATLCTSAQVIAG